MDLFLDHVSFEVDDLRKSKDFVETLLGFTLTLTPQQPDSHSIIRLDRSYIEVWKPEERTTASQKFPTDISLYFLRAANFNAFLQDCKSRNIPIKDPVEYVAASGSVWYDVEFDAPIADLLPFVVQPIPPEETVKAWPYPLREEHPNALRTISAYHITTNRYNELLQFFSLLLNQDELTWQENPFFETEQVSFRLSNGRIVICKPSRPILEQTYLGPNGEGLFAITFKSGDVEKTQRFFSGSLLERTEDEFDIEWLMPGNELNIYLGYSG